MSTATTPSQNVLWNKSFILCVINYFLLFVYFYGLMTVLPIYILDDLGGSMAQSGLAMTVFLASAIMLRPFTGMIIQRIGRRVAFYGGMALFCLTAFAYLLIDDIESLLIIRFIQGIWFSLVTTVTVPIVNDFIPEKRKGEGIGYYMMALNVAMVCGPAVGLALVQHAPVEQLFLASAILTLVSFIVCLLLKVQEPAPIESTTLEKKPFQLSDIFEKRVVPITLVAMLTAMAYSSVLNFISLMNNHNGLLSYTSVFFLIFAVSMLSVRPFTGKLYDRKGPSAVLIPSMIIFIFALALTSLMTNLTMLVVCAVILGIGYSALFPGFQTMAIQSVEKTRVGHATSTFFTGFDIGLAAGASVLGIVLAWSSFAGVYLVGSAIMTMALILYYVLARKRS